jgi:hypothetical protein
MEMPCTRCEREIPSGTPYWSVTVQHEAMVDDEIEVIEAMCYHVLCEECAARSDFERIAVPEKPAG